MIKAGSWFIIPKGTLVYDGLSGASFKSKPQPREVKVYCKGICDLSLYGQWKRFLTDEECKKFIEQETSLHGNPFENKHPIYFSSSPFDQTYMKMVTDRIGRYVIEYGKDKYVSFDGVTETTVPLVEDKPKKVAVRSLLVKGSVWKFTKDADLTYNTRHYENYGTNACRTTYVPVPIVSVKAGDTFKVLDKSFSSYNDDGNLVPVEYNGVKYNVQVAWHEGEVKSAWPIKQIQDIVEPVDLPELNIFVFRDNNTGEFFIQSDGNAPLMGTFGQAKKYKKLGDMRASVMSLIGYFDGIEVNREIPYWLCGAKQFDIPTSWSIVRFDKLTKTEKEVLDVETTLKLSRMNRLHDLAVKGGASLRDLHDKLEKKKREDEVYLIALHHRGDQLLTDKIRQEIGKEYFESCESREPFAFAFQTAEVPLMLKMQYESLVAVSLSSLETLY